MQTRRDIVRCAIVLVTSCADAVVRYYKSRLPVCARDYGRRRSTGGSSVDRLP